MTSRLQFGRAALVALLASSTFLACETKLTELTEAVGPIAFNFAVGPAANGLPTGSVAMGAAAVTLTMSNLRALSGGHYQFWVLGRDAQNLDVPVQAFGTIKEFFLKGVGTDPITGDSIFETDSTSISDIRTDGYVGTDDPVVTSVRVILDSLADNTNPTTYHAVFVTLESGTASAPGAARFLWRRIGVGGAGSMLFGNFGGSDVVNLQSPRDYVFGPRGGGTGGARGAELSVDFRELARPPIGFVYRGYITDVLGDGVVVDELRSAWSRDSTISRVSMIDADVDDALPGVTGGDIRAAQIRNCASGSGVNNCQNTMALPADNTFVGYESFQLKLEPKGGAGPIRDKSVTLVGTLPDPVK
jgi:hypothetical protein